MNSAFNVVSLVVDQLLPYPTPASPLEVVEHDGVTFTLTNPNDVGVKVTYGFAVDWLGSGKFKFVDPADHSSELQDQVATINGQASLTLCVMAEAGAEVDRYRFDVLDLADAALGSVDVEFQAA